MTTRRVAVVVLNWNGWRDTLGCLDSLGPAVHEAIARVIVVDNASVDDSVGRIREWLQSEDRKFVELREEEIGCSSGQHLQRFEYALIHAKRNGGYAAGNNLGIALALRLSDTEFVFVLNNDTLVEPDCIGRLVAWAEGDPDAGIVGSTVVEEDGNLRIAGGNTYNLFSTKSKPVTARNGVCTARIDYVAGAAQFIRAEALRRVGLLSEDYFLYFEELDLTRRITKAGFSITWCPGGVVHHAGGRAAGSRSHVNKKSPLAEYHSNLSCLIFMTKFHPRLLLMAAATRFLSKIFHDLIHFRPTLLPPLIRAYRDYFVWARSRHT